MFPTIFPGIVADRPGVVYIKPTKKKKHHLPWHLCHFHQILENEQNTMVCSAQITTEINSQKKFVGKKDQKKHVFQQLLKKKGLQVFLGGLFFWPRQSIHFLWRTLVLGRRQLVVYMIWLDNPPPTLIPPSYANFWMDPICDWISVDCFRNSAKPTDVENPVNKYPPCNMTPERMRKKFIFQPYIWYLHIYIHIQYLFRFVFPLLKWALPALLCSVLSRVSPFQTGLVDAF